MSEGPQTLTINHSVFKWLFESSGCTIDEIASETGISQEKWHLILGESSSPVSLSITTIKKLGTLYHRPITAFLISEVPPDSNTPKDFRRNASSPPYSKDLFRKFSKTRRNLKIFMEMKENLGEPSVPSLPHITINENPFLVAETERKRLNLESINISKKANEAYKQWRTFLSEQAIPVFQYNMTKDGVRGFVIRYGDNAAITVNSGDTDAGRIFTIFHEYAHLLLKTQAVCTDDGEDGKDTTIGDIERWCDNFAGAFLIPEKAVYENSKITQAIEKKNYAAAAKELTKTIAVSKAAALVRLRVMRLVPADAAAKELTIWKEKTYAPPILPSPALLDDEDEEQAKSPTSQKIDRAKLVLAELGTPYVALASRNYDGEHISYTGYLNTLGISKNSYERLKKKGVIE